MLCYVKCYVNVTVVKMLINHTLLRPGWIGVPDRFCGGDASEFTDMEYEPLYAATARKVSGPNRNAGNERHPQAAPHVAGCKENSCFSSHLQQVMLTSSNKKRRLGEVAKISGNTTHLPVIADSNFKKVCLRLSPG
jgi:hypothetical protein